MAHTSRTLEVERPAAWQVGEQEDEGRWPVYKTVLFVVASSAALWGGIVASLAWLW